jgi:hypothetical protein
MNAYVIMHNMIIESECGETMHDDQSFDYQGPLAEVAHVPPQFSAFLHIHQEIRDADVHVQLRADLATHLWEKRGATNNA